MSLVPASQAMATTTLEKWRDVAEMAKLIANTDFVPKSFRNNPAAVTAAILTGTELGFSEMASLSTVFVIEGRPGLYAEAMRALVQSKGHEIWPDDEAYTASRVTLYGRRAESDKVVKVTWTMDMAKAANLTSKHTWRAFPRSMLLARATGELCRLLFADVLRGVSYTVEELEDGFVGEEPAPTGELGSGGEEPKAITRKAAPARKGAAKKAAAPAASAAPRSEPPLPPLPGEDGESGEDEQVRVKRAQQIAMRCGEAGLDDDGRHRLISAVTNGRVASAKEVSAEEGADVLAAVIEIKAGRKTLLEGESGWELVEIEDATGDAFEPDGDGGQAVGEKAPHEWSGDEWRQFLATHGVKVTEVLREAHRLCKSSGEFGGAPATLDELRGSESLAALLQGWVEDRAEASGQGEML